MPYFSIAPGVGQNPGTVRPIVLERCATTGIIEYAIDTIPRDLPPQLVQKAMPIIEKLGYRLIEVPTPDEKAAFQAEQQVQPEPEPEPVQEEVQPVQEEELPPPQPRRPPWEPQEPTIQPSENDEQEEVS